MYSEKTMEICVFCDEGYKEKNVKRIGVNVFPEGLKTILIQFQLKNSNREEGLIKEEREEKEEEAVKEVGKEEEVDSNFFNVKNLISY